MDLHEFRKSFHLAAPPLGMSPALQALWYEATDRWDQAHHIVQQEADPASAWVHAYLHRKEGDTGNAAYWYRRANRPPASGPLAQEWEAIALALLAQQETVS